MTTTVLSPSPSPDPDVHHHQQQHHHQIRHAGRTMIRGKIRRIWRPRYLELWDNAVVRYYELPPSLALAEAGAAAAAAAASNETTSNTYDNDGDEVNEYEDELVHSRLSSNNEDETSLLQLHKIPKYTLRVYAARILDVTTLRDMHVGLPQGSFGFVFRGQRLIHLEEDDDDEYNDSKNDAFMRMMEDDEGEGEATSFMESPRPGAGETSVASASLSSLLLHNLQCGGAPEVQEQRDFLCAVNTLEEAQMWVIALQWAAQQALPATSLRTTSTAITPSSESLSNANHNWWRWQVVETDEFTPTTNTTGSAAAPDSTPGQSQTLRKRQSVGGFTTATATYTATASPKRSRAASEPSLSATEVVAAAAAVFSSDTSMNLLHQQPDQSKPQPPKEESSQPQPHQPPPNKQQGKVVVARVVNYHLVRRCTTAHTSASSGSLLGFFGWKIAPWHLDIAYEIHTLLIQNNVVEELVLLRTAQDLSQLLQVAHSAAAAAASTTTSSSSCPVVSPRLIRLCQQLPQNNSESLAKSVSIVDSILRSLVLDVNVVNTPAMKDFLGLDSSYSPPSPTTTKTKASGAMSSALTSRIPLLIWQLQDSRTVHSRTTTELNSPAEDYVRQWLQDRNHRPTSSTATTTTTANSYTALNASTLDDWALRIYQRYYCNTKKGTTSWTTAVVGLSVVAATALPFAMAWQYMPPYFSIPRLSLRLDALVGSWMTAAYLGRLYEQEQRRATARQADKKTSAKKPMMNSASSSRAARNRVRRTVAGAVASTTPSKDNKTSATVPGVEQEGAQDVAKSLLLAEEEEESDGEELIAEDDYLAEVQKEQEQKLSSPLPEYPSNQGKSCWSKPRDDIFHVRGPSYLQDRVKIPSGPGALSCRGVDIWITDNPERHISRHPSVLGGKLGDEDTFLVNFLLPFGNFVAYFSIPPLEQFPSKQLATVWTNFLKGDQQYRDARLKLLPVVMDGPWIVKTAVGGGKSPALLGKVIPLQYFFRHSDEGSTSSKKKGVYEVDVIITASTIAKGILSVVKGHTKSVSIAFAFIIEAAEQEELPETILCSFQVHSLHLEDCPILPECNLDQYDDHPGDPSEEITTG